MKCKNCNQENEKDGIFCIKCGLSLKEDGDKKIDEILFVPNEVPDHTFRNIGLIIAVIAVISFIGYVVAVSGSDTSTTDNSLSSSYITPTDQWQTFTSVEHRFSALLPVYPTTTRDPEQTLDNGYSFTTTNYSGTENDGAEYYIQVGDYDILSENYDNKVGLEGMVNAMNNNGVASVSNTSFTKQNGFDAITFNFSNIEEKFEGKGIGIIKDDLESVKAFLILVGSPTGDTTIYQKIINSLEFN